ncbi:hypothetical protein FOZ60_007333 [Perkinsus olseni]|uniref:Cytochrome P450 n=1 Tax=Perkinsus olseni TaxID=32597 RepID=A0A7J6NM71_PEROL|nr:hypothetical protein FOZ60_007333 [Perkinsus olseni]
MRVMLPAYIKMASLSHKAVIIATGVASVLALKVLLRLVQGAKVDLHALFGGPNRFLPFVGFIPKSLDHLCHALEIYADTYGGLYHIKLEPKLLSSKALSSASGTSEYSRGPCMVAGFVLRVTGMDVVVVSEPELIRQVQDERPKTYIRSFNKHKIMPVPGMFNTEGEEWKRNRRLGAPAFNDNNSDAMVPDMSEVALKLLKSLSQTGRIVWRPTEWLPLCTLDVLCVTTLGNDYNFLNPDGISLGYRYNEVQQAIADAMAGAGYVAQLSSFPWMTRDRFPWNLNPMIEKLHTGVRRLNRVCDEIISARRAEQQAGRRVERRDLLDKLLHLDEEDLRGNLIADKLFEKALKVCIYDYYTAGGLLVFAPRDGSSLIALRIDQGRVRDHLAFGGGPRQCPGQNMAIRESHDNHNPHP